jgi:hypothetical protein
MAELLETAGLRVFSHVRTWKGRIECEKCTVIMEQPGLRPMYENRILVQVLRVTINENDRLSACHTEYDGPKQRLLVCQID